MGARVGTGWFVWDGITIYREMREGEWAIPIQSVNVNIFNHELIELSNIKSSSKSYKPTEKSKHLVIA